MWYKYTRLLTTVLWSKHWTVLTEWAGSMLKVQISPREATKYTNVDVKMNMVAYQSVDSKMWTDGSAVCWRGAAVSNHAWCTVMSVKHGSAPFTMSSPSSIQHFGKHHVHLLHVRQFVCFFVPRSLIAQPKTAAPVHHTCEVCSVCLWFSSPTATKTINMLPVFHCEDHKTRPKSKVCGSNSKLNSWEQRMSRNIWADKYLTLHCSTCLKF